METLKIKVDREALADFQSCEYPSYEDYMLGEITLPDGYKHQYEILSRYKTQIVMYDEKELEMVWYALCSGTFQLGHYTKTVKWLADKLLPYVQKQCSNILKDWEYPDFA